MTLNYGIFDSADPASPDRTYTATLLSRILSKYLSNGVVSGDLNELKVSVTDPPAMKVIVATGTAIVQGRFIENDAALTLNVSAAHATYPRIDRVVVRLSAVTARMVDIAVKAGTAASSPVAPALTQTSDVYEIPLAQIAVGAGVTSILTANITDERVFPDMTNLFKASVAMLGDLSIGGSLSVSGSLSVPSGTITSNFIGPLTGSATKFDNKTPAQYAATLRCALVNNGNPSMNYTHYVTQRYQVIFPLPLKSNTTISAYGARASYLLYAIMMDGTRTKIGEWFGAGTLSCVVPAGAMGLTAHTGSAELGIYINIYFTLTT